MLLGHGANPNAAYGGCSTPLMASASHTDPAMARLLLDHGARPDVVHPEQGLTAFHIACFHGAVETACLLRC